MPVFLFYVILKTNINYQLIMIHMVKRTALFLLIGILPIVAAAQSIIKIDGSATRTPISPSQYGIFFEEISHGGEGGLYAEMIQNRSFEDYLIPSGCVLKDGYAVAPEKPDYFTGEIKKWKKKWDIDPLSSWKLTVPAKAKAIASVTDSIPLNSATPHAALLAIDKASAENMVVFSNSGFWGISVKEGEKYNVRLFLNTPRSYKGELTIKITASDGKNIGEQKVKLLKNGKWNEYKTQLTALATDTKSTFDLCFDSPGKIMVDFVSMFPVKTFNNRENGLRADVAQKLADLKPAFIRWPGGCIVEGITLENRVKWKETLGDPVTRTGEYDTWGYRNTYGWGYHEYLQFCEDIGAAALYVCNVGIACEFRNGDYCSDDSVKYFIQDALDAIEYAIGDVSTTWGAKRAATGHPAPFPLKYVEIGNENRGPIYYKRHNQFYASLKAKYPQILYILNTNFGEGKYIVDEASREVPKADIADLHWYESPEWFFNHTSMFDSIKPRPKFKLYVGEYACNKDVGAGNLYGALSEAAFISGMERNSDVVTMTSYAPLFENSNQRNWPVNLIWINNSQVFGRTSYYVQKMYAQNLPDENLGTTVVLPEKPVLADFSGTIGLATYNTAAEFRDIVVTSGKNEVYRSDFINRAAEWDTASGKWTADSGIFQQTELEPFRIATLKNQTFSNYTLELKARKTKGSEGFIILFGSKDAKNRYSINIGGWNNAYSAVEKVENGRSATISETILSKIETGRWYTIKIIASFPDVECYLDGKLLIKHRIKDFYKQYAVAGFDKKTKEIILKVVNAEPKIFTPKISLANMGAIASEGKIISISSASGKDENTFSSPMKISPVKEKFTQFSNNFTYNFKPWSFTILRIKVK
jgi:alpha-L-arabinofuranosidase